MGLPATKNRPLPVGMAGFVERCIFLYLYGENSPIKSKSPRHRCVVVPSYGGSLPVAGLPIAIREDHIGQITILLWLFLAVCTVPIAFSGRVHYNIEWNFRLTRGTRMKEFIAGQFDIAVIGAGHAGIEAALAAARLGLETVCFTINLDAVGNMPCNPAIGGTGKGHPSRG